MTRPLAPHGGYRELQSYRTAEIVYDGTVAFCRRFVSGRLATRVSPRTRDQMVQAARSGVQNIAEGSQASGTSKKMELKLTNVARASLEELRLDYEDFLRQRGLDQQAHADQNNRQDPDPVQGTGHGQRRGSQRTFGERCATGPVLVTAQALAILSDTYHHVNLLGSVLFR